MAENKQDLEPLLNTQQNQLDLVLSDATSIDNKTLAILASNVALMIFIGQAELGLVWWQFMALLTPFAASLLLDGFAIWPRQYEGHLIDLKKHPQYLKMWRDKLILQLLANTESAIHFNLLLNALRWRYCVLSIILTGLGTVILFAILII